jgi:hypothetical protein
MDARYKPSGMTPEGGDIQNPMPKMTVIRYGFSRPVLLRETKDLAEACDASTRAQISRRWLRMTGCLRVTAVSQCVRPLYHW